MNKTIPILMAMLLLPTMAMADMNVTTNIYTTGDVHTETNINTTGDTTVEINGVPWTYEPEVWSRDRVGITRGDFYKISTYFYTPWRMPHDTYRIATYLVDIIHKVMDPQIRELQYQNEALRYMLKDVYKDQFDKKYCEAKCKVANDHNLDYVMCGELRCSTGGHKNVWYCDKSINENATVGVYVFNFNKIQMEVNR